ncbi:hypothetical protein OZL92_17665 [Bacillus sonorensis]|uniref:Uncharacterized protein n=2 Tax=Bacillus sonorensis TaxID=119858 RepID=M5NY50_9BACI|nr:MULTISPECIES: hypothetical protein [Bacillus]TWK84180.1 hypothetical protein CHCC20335_4248 [Bacillus paralicheniformis]ASB89194.1 hypothetical protein S101395_02687 [Bacillus sonorensis]ASB89197.1 hypothetical protein S101395_02690 [Bacillus sonorensis]EME72154.1 hypothetical protein BSONL12_22680 [Bacillus sonorensis L12]MCY7858721.1 hypothetical protein [Bacillus sonorensis]
MLLHNTEGYTLTKDIQIKENGHTYIKREALNRDLNIGEAAYVGHSRNKRLSEEEYMFIRKEPVTYENDTISKKLLNKLKRLIEDEISNDICLSSEEKVKHIKSIIKRNPWIEDMSFISCPSNMSNEDLPSPA